MSNRSLVTCASKILCVLLLLLFCVFYGRAGGLKKKGINDLEVIIRSRKGI